MSIVSGSPSQRIKRKRGSDNSLLVDGTLNTGQRAQQRKKGSTDENTGKPDAIKYSEDDGEIIVLPEKKLNGRTGQSSDIRALGLIAKEANCIKENVGLHGGDNNDLNDKVEEIKITKPVKQRRKPGAKLKRNRWWPKKKREKERRERERENTERVCSPPKKIGHTAQEADIGPLELVVEEGSCIKQSAGHQSGGDDDVKEAQQYGGEDEQEDEDEPVQSEEELEGSAGQRSDMEQEDEDEPVLPEEELEDTAGQRSDMGALELIAEQASRIKQSAGNHSGGDDDDVKEEEQYGDEDEPVLPEEELGRSAGQRSGMGALELIAEEASRINESTQHHDGGDDDVKGEEELGRSAGQRSDMGALGLIMEEASRINESMQHYGGGDDDLKEEQQKRRRRPSQKAAAYMGARGLTAQEAMRIDKSTEQRGSVGDDIKEEKRGDGIAETVLWGKPFAPGNSQKVKRMCSRKDCTKWVVSNGKCSAHGGGKKNPCSVDGCTAQAVSKGVCHRHGGGNRKPCTFAGCTTLAAGRGLCHKHGGGSTKKPCSVEGCTSLAVAKTVCFRHGGDPRKPCTVNGCPKQARAGGRCFIHGIKKRRGQKTVNKADLAGAGA